MRELTFLWKDESSQINDCPALYKTAGGYIVQGVRITEEDRAQLRDMAGTEEAVFVPDNVLDRLTAYRVRHP